MKVLIINSKRNGLPVMRSLGARGLTIIAVDHFPDAIGFYSRYAAVREVVPLITDGEEAFSLAIADIGRRHGDGKKVLLIPTSDAHLLAFVRQWRLLESYFVPLFELDSVILNRCLDKTKVLELAETADVPIPRSAISPPTENRTQGMSFPLVVKPDIRSGPEAIAANLFRLKVCRTEDEVETAAAKLEDLGFNFVVQEYIPGGDDMLYTAGLYANNGEVLGIFTGRKLRQFPPAFGECSYGEIVKNKKIADYAMKLINTACFTGIAQVEFKRYDDEYYLIEINPRVWSWSSLAVVGGVDLAWIGYLSKAEGKNMHVTQNGWDGKWSYLSEDLRWDHQRDNPVGMLRILWQSLHADTHSIWRLSDPLPGVMQLLSDLGISLPSWLTNRVQVDNRQAN